MRATRQSKRDNTRENTSIRVSKRTAAVTRAGVMVVDIETVLGESSTNHALINDSMAVKLIVRSNALLVRDKWYVDLSEMDSGLRLGTIGSGTPGCLVRWSAR